MPDLDTPAAILVWNEIKKQLKKETSTLLHEQSFTLHKDAYVRLSDDDIVTDVPFLVYEYNTITDDESLDFSLYFYKDGFTLNIGPTQFSIGYPLYAYSATETVRGRLEANEDFSEKIVAENIVLTIKLLLNGQLAVGCSWKNGGLVAAEVFLLGFETKPYPISLMKNFSLFNQKATDYTVKRNSVLPEHVDVTDAFPLIPPVVNDKRVRRGRDVDSIHDLAPLTNKLATKIEDSYMFHESLGANPDASIVTNLYASVYFWVTALLIAGGVSYLHFADTTPEIFHNTFVFIAMVLVARYVISFIAAFLLGLRQAKMNTGANPLSYRFEQLVAKTFRIGKKQKHSK